MHCIVYAILLCLLADSVWSIDGEGTARMDTDEVVAGARTTLRVALQIGPSGLAARGGIALCFHHASSWPVQVDRPSGPGYVRLEGTPAANIDLSYDSLASPELLSEPPKTMLFHKCLIARLRNDPVPPAAKMAFVIGANEAGIDAHRHSDKAHEFHVLTDTDGDGKFREVAEHPRFDLIPGPTTQFYAAAPSTLHKGQTFALRIRTEDRFFNPTHDYSGTVSIKERDGRSIKSRVVVTDSQAVVSLVAEKTGPHRYTVSDGQITGLSNPLWVFNTPQKYKIYWGDIHNHTQFSDGLGDGPDQSFAFAKEDALLEVAAVSDHGYNNWPLTQQAVISHYIPGEFVTILGFEGGYGTNHINFYYRNPDANHITKWPKNYQDVYDIVHRDYDIGAKGILIGPHHFVSYRNDVIGDPYPFGLFDEGVMRFVEVYSFHGTSEYLGNPRPSHASSDLAADRYMQAGLAAGRKFGVLASTDDHTGHPGRAWLNEYPGGLVSFLATELTREGIWDAWWNRRVYATSFDKILLLFTINAQQMGSELAAAPPYRIKYVVSARSEHARVLLIRNNETIREDQTIDGAAIVNLLDTPPTDNNYYYIRVEQDNGERAWSSPIWTRQF